MVTVRDGESLPAAATFLVVLHDDSLEPQYHRGATLYVDTRQPPRPGDTVLVTVNTTTLLAVLHARSAGTLTLKRGAASLTLPRESAGAVYRVVPPAELLL
jgi:phage repressor protein C with HTH and peptisase S24 domain